MAAYSLLIRFNRRFQSCELRQGIESEILIKIASKDIPSDFPIHWLVQLIDKQLEKNQKVIVVSGQVAQEISYYMGFSMYQQRTLRRYRKLLVEGALPLVALSSRFPHLALAYGSLFGYLVRTHELSLPLAYGSLPKAHVPDDFPIEYLLEAVDTQIAELDPAAIKREDSFALIEYRKMLEEGTLCSFDQGYIEGCEVMESKRTPAPNYSWYQSAEFPLYVKQQAEKAWKVHNSKSNNELTDGTYFVKGYCDGYHKICQEWMQDWSST